MAKAVAFLISRILGPLPLLCLLWFVTAVKSGIGFWKALWVYPVIFVFCLGIPTLITTYILIKRKVIDFDWTKREQRLVPLVTYLSFAIPGALLVRFLTNQTIFHLYLLLLFIGMVSFIITIILKYKISLHMSAAFGAFSAINLFTHQQYLWLFFLLIPIMWARLVLKQHTLNQLIAGIIVPAVITGLSVLLFGWPKVP